MSEPWASGERERVDAWLRAAPRHELLPPRRRDATPPSVPVAPLDALRLGPGIALAVAQAERGLAVVPVADTDSGPRRAVPGDGVFSALLGLMSSSRKTGAFSARSASSWHLDAGSGAEVAIAADQSNDSVIVAGWAVVKLFPFTLPWSRPGVDLPTHLAAVGFTSIPVPLGALSWITPTGEETVLATASTYLPGARDGWHWYLERLLGWLDGDVDDAVAFEPARVLGAIVAEMHIALATPSAIEPAPSGRSLDATADSWRREALHLAGEALAVTDGDEGTRLASRMPAIRRELQRIGRAAGVTMTPVHGDLHVGQVLEWEGGYAVTDFDGNPMAPARRSVDTPVRDVAAFVRSVDHLGRVASRRRPDQAPAVESWIGSSRSGFLHAYRNTLAASGADALYDERLLRPLEVAQECHEYVYAARFLPRWRYVPDLAMQALFPESP